MNSRTTSVSSVNQVQPKPVRLQLEADEYEELLQQVLRRDAWRCQLCGARCNLEVHHKKLCSQLRDDSEQNLITLCTTCHQHVHRQSARDEVPSGE